MSDQNGRPTKYIQEYDDQAYKLCLLGHTDAEMADFFEVTEQTINNWKNAHPSFFESIKRGKEIADVEVVESLRKRALGYKYKEVHSQSTNKGAGSIDPEEVQDPEFIVDESNGFKQIKVIEKEVAPDVTAQIFWLKNRQSKKWRDKQEVDHSTGGKPLTITVLPASQKDG